MSGGAHSGEWKTILEWFQEHPEREFTIREIAGEFKVSYVLAGNAIQHWVRKNDLIKVAKGTYRLRQPGEVREEFKVARTAVMAEKAPETPKPLPIFSGKVHPIVWALCKRAAKEGRVTIVNSNTVFVWNSPERRQVLARMAYSH